MLTFADSSKGSEICLKPLYLISFYHTYINAICDSTMQQKESQFMLQDREIDHRQHAGNNSISLHMNT
jgi:hypothetical protein